MSQIIIGHLKSAVLLCALVYVAISCVGPRKPVFQADYVPPQNSITIMTYNVENLFDIKDDLNKNDEAYLPLSAKNESVKSKCRASNSLDSRLKDCLYKDWNSTVLARKMKRLADVIRQVKNGQGADVLILQEVENRDVLEQLRTEYLSGLGYKPALLVEGPDERGIDVGVLTKLNAIPPLNLHELKFTATEELPSEKISATRGILEVNLKLTDGTPLTILGVHLPSQGSPTEARRQALVEINKIKASLPADRLVIVGGDFNISSDEENKKGILAKEMLNQWGISHIIGCQKCSGTYFYPKGQEWSFFDIILVSQNMLEAGQAPWKVLPQSVRIENSSIYQNNRFGSPSRFDERKKDGVSDHWPMVLEIIKR